MAKDDFLIAGGGIAGLAAALALARAGRRCRLFERAAAFEEVGAGLQMSPNGVAALRALGAWDAIEPHCVIPTEIHVRLARSGRLLQRIRLGKGFEQRFGAPYRVVHRADLLAGLVTAARGRNGIELNTDASITGCALESATAELQLASGTTARGTAIIAADGIRSLLRKEIDDAAQPVFRGQAIYRALVPFASVPSGIEPDCVTLWLHEGGHVVHYPVSNWRQFNIVAAIDGKAPEGGWGMPSDGAGLRLHFRDCDESLGELLRVPESWLAWQGTDLPQLARWTKENLALIGDAAHATLPYLAQGAVMALEDACILGRAVENTPSDPATAFASYAERRIARTGRIQSESRKLARIYHLKGVAGMARNLALKAMGPEEALRRYRWIYEWRPD